MRGHFQRHALYPEAVAAQALQLARIVGQQPHLADSQVAQDLRADPIVAQVLLEAQLEVGLDRVQSAILQRVGPDLVAQSDPAALLMEIDNHAGVGRQDPVDRFVQLLPAVASRGTEYIAGQALGMKPYQRGSPPSDLALD